MDPDARSSRECLTIVWLLDRGAAAVATKTIGARDGMREKAVKDDGTYADAALATTGAILVAQGTYDFIV
jgi:hypothetical protein